MTTESVSVLSRVAAALTAEASAELDRLRQQARPGRAYVTTEVMSVFDALARPDLASAVRNAVLVAFAAAKGEGSGAMCECGWCRRPWGRRAGPAAVFVLRLTRPASGMVGLLCPACATADPSSQRGLMLEAVRRDLMPDAETIATAPGGRA